MSVTAILAGILFVWCGFPASDYQNIAAIYELWCRLKTIFTHASIQLNELQPFFLRPSFKLAKITTSLQVEAYKPYRITKCLQDLRGMRMKEYITFTIASSPFLPFVATATATSATLWTISGLGWWALIRGARTIVVKLACLHCLL